MKALSDAERARVELIEDKGREFWQLVGEMGYSREMDIAQVKIEEAIFWAVKSITR